MIPMRYSIITAALALAIAPGRAPAQAEIQERDAAPIRQPQGGQGPKAADRELAVAHALAMAIEGSELWAGALVARALDAAQAGGQPQPVGERTPLEGVRPPERVAREGDRVLENPARATSRTATDAGRPPGTGADVPAAMLEQHAREAFGASNALFTAIQGEERNRSEAVPGPDQAESQASEQFRRAAWEYSRALEGLCRQEGAREGGRAAADAGTPLAARDAGRLAVINHAVKEVAEGMALRQMLRDRSDSDETSRALATHARRMVESGRRALQMMENEPGRNLEAAPVEGREGGIEGRAEPRAASLPVATLARAAREVAEAALRLDADGGAPAEGTTNRR